MTVKVVYRSKGGNTKKLAEAVAKGAGVVAETVEDARLDGKVDLMFVGGALYAANIDKGLAEFLGKLTPEQVGKVVLFSSSAAGNSIKARVEAILVPKGIPVEELEYYCKGSFLLANRGRPNVQDLEAAAEFAKSML